MIIDGKRYNGVFVWRERGIPIEGDPFHLIILVTEYKYRGGWAPKFSKQWRGYWLIPLQYEGGLACTAPSQQNCYEVSWKKIPEDLKPAIRKCVLQMVEKGTPMENDEHIYG